MINFFSIFKKKQLREKEETWPALTYSTEIFWCENCCVEVEHEYLGHYRGIYDEDAIPWYLCTICGKDMSPSIPGTRWKKDRVTPSKPNTIQKAIRKFKNDHNIR